MDEVDHYLVHHFESELYKEFTDHIKYIFCWFMKWVE